MYWAKRPWIFYKAHIYHWLSVLRWILLYPSSLIARLYHRQACWSKFRSMSTKAETVASNSTDSREWCWKLGLKSESAFWQNHLKAWCWDLKATKMDCVSGIVSITWFQLVSPAAAILLNPDLISGYSCSPLLTFYRFLLLYTLQCWVLHGCDWCVCLLTLLKVWWYIHCKGYWISRSDVKLFESAQGLTIPCWWILGIRACWGSSTL